MSDADAVPEPELAELEFTPEKDRDSGAMVRTGSARSNRSSTPGADSEDSNALSFRSPSFGDLSTLSTPRPDLGAPHVHIVESEVYARDLTATWQDQQAGFSDWRKCLVSGSHLPRQNDRQGKKEPPAPVAMADAGAKGEVLRATWKSSIQVAIKKNLNPLIQNEDEVALFLELHHPHVVACYGVLKEYDDGTLMTSIVTERCTTSLEQFLDDHDQWKDKEPNTIDMMKYTIVQHIALGLQKLHDMNVLHRDIKANNILLDGTPGECPTCEHSGKWKICDFGEAKVLKMPTLSFSEYKPWPKGWSHSLIDANRFQPITSPFLREQGARHYCWLLPGETLTPAPDHDLPPDATSPVEEWVPCQHGGFVYSFNDDPAFPDLGDRYFDIAGVSDKPVAQPEQLFPQSLGPFGLTPTELLPELNFDDFTYQLRNIRHENEQLELLKSFGVTVKGRFSPVSALTLPASARRTAMVPEDATHFVWAYQGTNLEELSTEQSSKLKTDSGELSFVSLGGYVYLRQIPEDGSYRVVRANAIALEMGKTCRSGTVDRAVCGKETCDPEISHTCADGMTPCDNGVTASVASPELLDGAGIGLETDIYALGIVMWEVFTRRKAWHWLKVGPETDNAIIAQVALGRRPKMPKSLSKDCAGRIRQCLHEDPAQRPSATKIASWVNTCRSDLAEAMKGKRKEVVRGRDMDKDGGKSLVKRSTRAIHDRLDEHWSLRGRYSLYPSSLQTGSAGFTLTVVDCTLDEWMENALTGSDSKPAKLDKLSKMKASKFGLKFEKDDGHGKKAKTWPKVAAIEQGDTIAAEFPSIKTGCVLKKINNEDAPSTFKLAVPMLKSRPLTLEFTSAVAEHTNAVTPWIHAALLEIGLVRRHEARKLLQHRQVSPCCGKPHCEEPACTQEHPCPLKRTLSAGWLAISPAIDSDSATVTDSDSVTVNKEFFRKCVCLAAKDAWHDAVDILRSHEASKSPHAEIEEGEPHRSDPMAE